MYLRYHIPSPSEHNHHHHHHHHHSLARAGGGVVKVVVQKMSWLLHVAFCCSSLALPRVAHTANHRQIEITWRDARVAAAVSKSFVLCPCFLLERHSIKPGIIYHHHHHHYHSLARADGGAVMVVVVVVVVGDGGSGGGARKRWLLHAAFLCYSSALPRFSSHHEPSPKWDHLMRCLGCCCR